ncbi:MAG: DUF3987 domain-containing protein [Planctomycetes bacterium]|nr:DUF3987 domain-containing protein [Planctomycetota bacterium]
MDGTIIEKLKARRMPDAYKPFPVECIPEPIRTYIVEAAKTLGCDNAYIVLPMLSALAGAIGNSRSIMLKQAWTEPAVIWSGIIGDSGSMKSPAIDMAMKPLRKIQNEAFREQANEMEQFQRDQEEYEKALREHKSGLDMPDKPVEPIAKRYYCSDITVEALASLLSNAPRGMLLVRDELSGWIRSFNSYKSGKGGDDAKWLELHRAGTLLVDRKSGPAKTVHIPNAAVSILGGIQPSVLAQVLGTEHFENGLAARMLMAMPPRQVKFWTEADIDEQLAAKAEDIFRTLLAMQMECDEYGGWQAQVLPLNPAAQDAWIAFYNEHAAEAAATSGEMAAAMSKLEAYAARLALVIHCIRAAAGDPDLASSNFIDDNSIIAGALIVIWFKTEIKRVYAALREGELERQQRQLIELIRKKGGRITVRELMQGSRQYRESAEAANSALQDLADIGWGCWENLQDNVNGGRPSRVFVLNNETAGYKTPCDKLE